MTVNRILGFDCLQIDDNYRSLFIKYVEIKFTTDKVYSYFSGSAGLILILKNLYSKFPDEKLRELLLSMGKYLIGKACYVNHSMITWEKEYFDKWGGVAHGNSYIAYALFELASFTQSEFIYDNAVRALKYDQSLFDYKKKIFGESPVIFEGENTSFLGKWIGRNRLE